MKLKNIAIVSASIIILLFIVRELGAFNSQNPKYNIKQDFSHNLEASNVKITTSKSGFHTDFGKRNFSQTDIFFRNSEEKKNPNQDYGLEITIKKLNIPATFIPFYTNIDYELDASIADNISSWNDDTKNLEWTKKTVSGNIVVKGNFKSHELLSNKQIAQIIAKESKLYVSQQLRNYLSATN